MRTYVHDGHTAAFNMLKYGFRIVHYDTLVHSSLYLCGSKTKSRKFEIIFDKKNIRLFKRTENNLKNLITMKTNLCKSVIRVFYFGIKAIPNKMKLDKKIIKTLSLITQILLDSFWQYKERNEIPAITITPK